MSRDAFVTDAQATGDAPLMRPRMTPLPRTPAEPPRIPNSPLHWEH